MHKRKIFKIIQYVSLTVILIKIVCDLFVLNNSHERMLMKIQDHISESAEQKAFVNETGVIFEDSCIPGIKNQKLFIDVCLDPSADYPNFPSAIYKDLKGIHYEKLEEDLRCFKEDIAITEEFSRVLSAAGYKELANSFVLKEDDLYRYLFVIDDPDIIEGIQSTIVSAQKDSQQNSSVQLEFLVIKEKDLIKTSYDFFAVFDSRYSDAIPDTMDSVNPYFLIRKYLDENINHRIVMKLK